MNKEILGYIPIRPHAIGQLNVCHFSDTVGINSQTLKKVFVQTIGFEYYDSLSWKWYSLKHST